MMKKKKTLNKLNTLNKLYLNFKIFYLTANCYFFWSSKLHKQHIQFSCGHFHDKNDALNTCNGPKKFYLFRKHSQMYQNSVRLLLPYFLTNYIA